MKFGSFKLSKAKGGILAHSISLDNGKRLRKGIQIDDAILEQLREAQIETVILAMPQKGDVLEDVAAAQIAQKLKADNLVIEEASTGRVNIFASANGLFRVDATIINEINAIDPSITIATLPDNAPVNKGRLVATIKIIPYAVSKTSLDCVLALQLSQSIRLHSFLPKRIGMVSTTLPSLKPSVMDKTRDNLERRLALSGSSIVEELRVAHDAVAISDAINHLESISDLIIIFGASAISDSEDCIPKAIEHSGGKIIRFGMPVDPGNLMLLAELASKPIIGAPGCARSIAENGFDWVLQRLLADVSVSNADLAQMGVGGLLMETGSRPHPREKKAYSSHATAAIILAAGQSRRMGEANKMTVEIMGKPMVRHVGEAVDNSAIENILVITGYRADEVKIALQGLEISDYHNPDYDQGLSTSIACGIKSLSQDVSSALILLGDMPFITSEMINILAKTASEKPNHIIVSTHRGKRGNPVLWPRAFFDELCTIQGDVGARHIMAANQDRVIEVELGEAASLDLDTPEAVRLIHDKA